MQWGVKQKWTDGKNPRYSIHANKDDVQAFARQQYDGGISSNIVQSGSPTSFLMLKGEAEQVNRSKYGIWK